MQTIIWLVLFISLVGVLAFNRVSLWVTTLSMLAFILVHGWLHGTGPGLFTFEIFLFVIVAVLFNLRGLRRRLISKPILHVLAQQMPTMSITEKEALTAGTVGWETTLFSGIPKWNELLKFPLTKLTEEEQAFLEDPVETVCQMTQDWEVTHKHADLTAEVWQYLKSQGFFGLIIPKQYGGKEFSASAHSAILIKLYSRSVTLASTVAVPNSLGPAELLLHYGTQQQKDYYLPRLACGAEVPCFALTNPEAGSDASSIPDYGIVCRGMHEGKEIVGVRLTWEKRYITLAPVATVLGLAFKLYDPDHLIGKQENLGITCALIPVNTAGVQIGQRHFPLNIVFQNGPTHGKDVFIPLDWIIGGVKMAGHGWRMLVECLSAGRSISLPSSAVGGSKLASLTTGAYARIRKQFNVPIGYFEGVEEALTRIAGYTYMIDAALKLTLSFVDQREKPAILSAIMKYHATEYGRKVVVDAMDVHAGKGICLGPRNYLGRSYQGAPISITVEGANILTRSLIIFGQGVLRCHPYLLTEMEAIHDTDVKKGLRNFDRTLFSHVGFIISNFVRSLVLGLTNGCLTKVPLGPMQRYYRYFSRFSAAFALSVDFAIMLLGGNLKRKEKVSARLGDVLSMLYLGSATLKQYEQRGYPAEEKVLVEWVCRYLLYTMQQQLFNLIRSFPTNRWVKNILHFLVFPKGKHLSEPSDLLGRQTAKLLLSPNATRDRLVQGVYIRDEASNYVALLDKTLRLLIEAESLEKRVQSALHEKMIHGETLVEQLQSALETGILSITEVEQIKTVEKLRREVITVDDFVPEELRHS